jgi:hypothetical protein
MVYLTLEAETRRRTGKKGPRPSIVACGPSFLLLHFVLLSNVRFLICRSADFAFSLNVLFFCVRNDRLFHFLENLELDCKTPVEYERYQVRKTFISYTT